MAFHRPISVNEASDVAGVSVSAILKRIRLGQVVAVSLSGKGWLLCREQFEGKKFSESDFRKLCSRYVSVPEACGIVCKTDASVVRDLKSGKLDGFRLNQKAWAVLRSSAEKDIREYLSGVRSGLPGRRRNLSADHHPTRLKRQRILDRKKNRTTIATK